MLPSDMQIRTALDRAASMITDKPSIGQRVYSSLAIVEDGLACRVTEKNHDLVADLPRSMGGSDAGPSPSVLLRAALSSCIAMGVKMWAARKGVAIQRVEVNVQTDVDARGQFGVADAIAAGFEDVRVSIRLQSDADAKALQEIVDTSLRYSPLMDAFKRSHTIATNVEFNPPAEVR
ncbi:MAG TPA: OsmC family protein [Hyphomonadaceae bacterium]|nr:OsmC family protein [Hyphomonadaceae bacterium]